jgi:hypothetical protein
MAANAIAMAHTDRTVKGFVTSDSYWFFGFEGMLMNNDASYLTRWRRKRPEPIQCRLE